MTVEIDQQYQEIVEATANILFQLKQRDEWVAISVFFFQLNKDNDEMDIQLWSKLRIFLPTLF